MARNSDIRVNGDPKGAAPFTITLNPEAVENLNYLCGTMGGLKKSQVIAYALAVLADRERARGAANAAEEATWGSGTERDTGSFVRNS